MKTNDQAAGRLPEAAGEQEQINVEGWSRGVHLSDYDNRTLRPGEVIVLARHFEPLSGRVLEIGCGAGRVLGYLAEVAEAAHGIDVSEAAVQYCRRRYPAAQVEVGDLRRLDGFAPGSLTAVWATDNVLDVVNDASRREVLNAVRSMLAPDGVFIFSSHNREPAAASAPTAPAVGDGGGRLGRIIGRVLRTPPASYVSFARRRPRQIRNRRRLRRYEHREPGYEIRNDGAQDYGALHYYITRDAQEAQLREHGFRLLECVDGDGRPVPAGGTSPSSEIHYIAGPTEG